MDYMRGDAERHLHFLFDRYEAGYVELRALREGMRPDRSSIELAALFGGIDIVHAQIEQWMAQGRDIYLGVLPRDVSHIASGKVGEEFVSQVGVLWIDADRKLPGSSLDALASCDLVVESGNGWHGYATAPSIFSATTKDQRRKVKTAIRKWQEKVLPGTDNVSDLTRILRLAGTLNFKDRANPKRVRIVEAEPKPRPAVIRQGRPSSVAPPPGWTQEEEATYRRIHRMDPLLSHAGRLREASEPWPDQSALEDRYSWVIRILQRMMARGDSKESILDFAVAEGISKAEIQSARLSMEESDANL
jgi:hypothetical protein